MLLALAVLLGLQAKVTGKTSSAANDQMVLNVASQDHATARALNQTEMSAATGGGMTGCSQTVDASGDVYGTCCVDLWIFSICVSVNYSAVERTISSLF